MGRLSLQRRGLTALWIAALRPTFTPSLSNPGRTNAKRQGGYLIDAEARSRHPACRLYEIFMNPLCLPYGCGARIAVGYASLPARSFDEKCIDRNQAPRMSPCLR